MRILIAAFFLALAGCAPRQIPAAPPLAGDAPGLNVAEAALASGAPELALNVADAKLAAEPSNVKALVKKGDALYALGRIAEAEVVFRQAQVLEPGSTGAELGLGRIALGSNPAEAEAMFLEVIKRDRSNAVAWNDLGVARDLLGRHAPAQEAYTQAMALDPGMKAAQVNLGLSLALGGNPGKAIGLLRPLAETPAASQRVRSNLAFALTAAGYSDAAMRLLAIDLPQDQAALALQGYEELVAPTVGTLVKSPEIAVEHDPPGIGKYVRKRLSPDSAGL